MRLATSFNRSRVSEWLNGQSGRTFQVVAGTILLIVGVTFREAAWGLAALLIGLFPLTGGAFDLCYISALLGGPLKGEVIRDQQVPHGDGILAAQPTSLGQPSPSPTTRDQ